MSKPEAAKAAKPAQAVQKPVLTIVPAVAAQSSAARDISAPREFAPEFSREWTQALFSLGKDEVKEGDMIQQSLAKKSQVLVEEAAVQAPELVAILARCRLSGHDVHLIERSSDGDHEVNGKKVLAHFRFADPMPLDFEAGRQALRDAEDAVLAVLIFEGGAVKRVYRDGTIEN